MKVSAGYRVDIALEESAFARWVVRGLRCFHSCDEASQLNAFSREQVTVDCQGCHVECEWDENKVRHI